MHNWWYENIFSPTNFKNLWWAVKRKRWKMLKREIRFESFKVQTCFSYMLRQNDLLRLNFVYKWQIWRWLLRWSIIRWKQIIVYIIRRHRSCLTTKLSDYIDLIASIQFCDYIRGTQIKSNSNYNKKKNKNK